jgi:hypothetical protein
MSCFSLLLAGMLVASLFWIGRKVTVNADLIAASIMGADDVSVAVAFWTSRRVVGRHVIADQRRIFSIKRLHKVAVLRIGSPETVKK